MWYVIVGAGGIGGAIGGRLADAGHEVVLVARGVNAQALRTAFGWRCPIVSSSRTCPSSTRSAV